MSQPTTPTEPNNKREWRTETEFREARLKGLAKGRASQRLARCLATEEEEP